MSRFALLLALLLPIETHRQQHSREPAEDRDYYYINTIGITINNPGKIREKPFIIIIKILNQKGKPFLLMASPILTLSEAQLLAKSLFNIQDITRSSNLGSCQDANFRIVCNSKSYVLKVSNAEAHRDSVEFENSVIQHLGSSPLMDKYLIPTLVPRADGEGYVAVAEIGGQTHFVRALTFVEGTVMSEYKYLSEEVLHGFGGFVALTHKVLYTYDAAVLDRVTLWDMRHAFSNIVSRLDLLVDDSADFRKLLHLCSASMQKIVDEYSSCLKKQVIHGDLAYYNVIGRLAESGRPEVVGVIDFGDVIESWIVGDIAIAITPLLVMDDIDIVRIATFVLRGYLHERASGLTREEVLVLWPLVVLRAILIYVTVSALLVEDPNNMYLQDEVVLNKKLLFKVLSIPLYLAQAALLDMAQMTNSTNESEIITCDSFIADCSSIFEVDLGVFSELLIGILLHV